MYSYILLLHVLAATIWTGGHLVLATTILQGTKGKITIGFITLRIGL